MAAEAKYEQVRQNLLQAGGTDRYVHMCVGGHTGCIQPIHTFYVMYDSNSETLLSKQFVDEFSLVMMC